jgi:hypothetical protein
MEDITRGNSMRRVEAGIIVAAVAAALISACSESNTPTAPARTAESLSISGGRTLTEGETVNLVATVRWSTGETETVTDRVAWASDDPRIATVDGRGLVTAVAAGEGRIRASLTPVNSTLSIAVSSGAAVVIGRVRESAPTEQVMVGGATVTAVDAAGRTDSAVTDVGGRFTLRLVPGPARITVVARGYETMVTSADVARSGTDMSLGVTPELREIRTGFAIDPSPNPAFVDQRTFRADVHHAGVLSATYSQSRATASAQAHTCLEVRRRSDNRVIEQARGQYDGAAGPIQVPVVAGESYEVKFYSCNPFGPTAIVSLADFGGEIKHPN